MWRVGLGGCLKLNIPAGDNGSVCHAAPGKNTCQAVFSSDTAPLLIALDASVRLISSEGERTIPLFDLYHEDGIAFLKLKQGEIMADVILSPPYSNLKAVHRKIRQRESIDFPLVNVGIAARLETTAIARNIRIVLGAVASAPARVHEAEHLLEGLELTDNRIVLAGELAASVVNPMPNTAGTVAYRKRMAKVLVERTLRELRGL